ncbi:hypothetical protein B0H16DRAFT_1859963 [Mycena metata]|uniref:Uncharacterized protein n=1 Tax=Mycena metata TaxID=1033252 RepID=A0AAD7IHQ1_9AGAR|nr:hypothetical protein B0H16DRAFT_1859963 [Mycena metata]
MFVQGNYGDCEGPLAISGQDVARKEQSTDNRGPKTKKKLTPEATILHTETEINAGPGTDPRAPGQCSTLGSPPAELEPHPAAPPSPVRHIREDLPQVAGTNEGPRANGSGAAIVMGGTLSRTGERRDVGVVVPGVRGSAKQNHRAVVIALNLPSIAKHVPLTFVYFIHYLWNETLVSEGPRSIITNRIYVGHAVLEQTVSAVAGVTVVTVAPASPVPLVLVQGPPVPVSASIPSPAAVNPSSLVQAQVAGST